MTTLWVLVLLLFNGDVVVDSKLAGFPDEAACKAAQVDIEARANDKALDVWVGCMRADHKPKPVVEKRRGGNA